MFKKIFVAFAAAATFMVMPLTSAAPAPASAVHVSVATSAEYAGDADSARRAALASVVEQACDDSDIKQVVGVNVDVLNFSYDGMEYHVTADVLVW
jgi:hypothetical protein